MEHFRGNYDLVKHSVKTRRFDDAAEPLLIGWNYQVKRKPVSATKQRLAQTWERKQKLMKEQVYTTDDVVEEILTDVEEWLRELHDSGKIKKVGEA